MTESEISIDWTPEKIGPEFEVEFETGVDEEEISAHERPSASHQTVPLWYRNSAVDIDVAIAPLIGAMWDYGIDTTFCCEGWDVPEGEKAAAWEWRNHRAYILMPDNRQSFQWLMSLMKKMPMDSWEISFDTHEVQGKRICLRFPKRDIDRIYSMIRKQLEFRRNIAHNTQVIHEAMNGL